MDSNPGIRDCQNLADFHLLLI